MLSKNFKRSFFRIKLYQYINSPRVIDYSTMSKSDFLSVLPLENSSDELTQLPKPEQFKGLLKALMPVIGQDEERIIFAQVLLILKLEGLVGDVLTPPDLQLIDVLYQSILAIPEKREEAMSIAKDLLA